MATYKKIKQLRGKQNENMIKVIRYIAEEEGYMKCKNVQFRKLYCFFLKPKFEQAAAKFALNRNMTVSYRQYKKLMVDYKGRFPINIDIYLIALYDIMLGYQKKATLTPRINDMSYTQYMIGLLREQLAILTNPQNVASDYITLVDLAILRAVNGRLPEVDVHSEASQLKIYNNIW